jgi:hypothetical protein
MLQKAPGGIGRKISTYSANAVFHAGTQRAFRPAVLGISESLVTFIDGAGGALALVEFRLPSECRILDSLVGTLAAVGVQILHIQVRKQRDHVNHRLRVAECDGSEVLSPRRLEVQHALMSLVEGSLTNVHRPLAKAPRGRAAENARRGNDELSADSP